MHAKFQLARLCRSWIFEKVPYPCHTDTQTHTYLNAVVALAPAGNQIKLDLAGKLGLGTGQDRFLEKAPLSLSARHHTDRYVNAVVALAPAGNQFEFDLGGKLGLGPG